LAIGLSVGDLLGIAVGEATGAVGLAVGLEIVAILGFAVGVMVMLALGFAVTRMVGLRDGFAVGLFNTEGLLDGLDVKRTAPDHFLGVISVTMAPPDVLLVLYTEVQSDAFHTDFGVKLPATRSARPFWKK
jgi:hypothetical protein